MQKGNLAIIPARGGSKRIPRKNIKDFLGEPIIFYSIQSALNSNLFDEIMVSTDDEEIAEISIRCGAVVPFMRTLKTSTDEASTMDVIKEVLLNYNVKMDKQFDYVCCIYPTAPLISIKSLFEGFQLLINHNLTSVFPVVQFSYPIWRGILIDEKNYSKLMWPEYLNSRSQDLKPLFHDAGQWYWFDPLKIENHLFSDNSQSLILEEYEVQDIDNETDWKLAELKYRLINEN